MLNVVENENGDSKNAGDDIPSGFLSRAEFMPPGVQGNRDDVIVAGTAQKLSVEREFPHGEPPDRRKYEKL